MSLTRSHRPACRGDAAARPHRCQGHRRTGLAVRETGEGGGAGPDAGGGAGYPLPRLSVMFFAAENAHGDPYSLVIEAARRADAAGFEAVWLPERHFDRFGGPYPNPAVLAAAVTQVTSRIRIRAGSVILPLHDPLEVAEAWAMVDLLSRGRVDMAFGSGWNPNDFALSPDTFADAKGVLRTAWKSCVGCGPVARRGGDRARASRSTSRRTRTRCSRI